MALTKAQLIDLNANEMIIDLDGDTSITADTDDQIDIKIAGADDFRFTANTFTALSGSTIAAQALTATSLTTTGAIAIPNDGNIGSAGSRNPSFNNGYAGLDGDQPNESFNMDNYNLSVVDSPNTTSQLTYDVRVKLTNSSDTYNINRATNDENSSGRPRGVSTITCLEIDGS